MITPDLQRSAFWGVKGTNDAFVTFFEGVHPHRGRMLGFWFMQSGNIISADVGKHIGRARDMDMAGRIISVYRKANPDLANVCKGKAE